MISNESPMACADAVHAVHVAEVRPLGAEADRDLPGRQVDDGAEGMKNGEILRGPPSRYAMCSRSMVVNPPMPEPMNTPTRGAISGVTVELGVVHRKLRGGDGELNEDVHLLQFLFLDPLQRVEALDLAGKARRKRRRVEAGDRADATHAATEGIPVCLGADTNRRHQADAGHDDSPAQNPSVPPG